MILNDLWILISRDHGFQSKLLLSLHYHNCQWILPGLVVPTLGWLKGCFITYKYDHEACCQELQGRVKSDADQDFMV